MRVKHLLCVNSLRLFWLGNRDRLSDVQGEVTTATLRLDRRKKLGDVFYEMEMKLNVKCV